MVDLHIHTTESDGHDTPKEILEKAEKLKLSIISITDHESCSAYDMLDKEEVSKIFSGKVIKGIELKSCYNGRIIDILGYGIDTKIINEYLEDVYKEKTHAFLQSKYLKSFYDQAKEINLKLAPINELVWNPEKDWASLTFYNEIKKYKENYDKLPEDLLRDFETFRTYYHDEKTLFYIDKTGDYPTPDMVIKNIHKAGGKAFLAHIYRYEWIEDKIVFINDFINEFKLDGIECFYSSFTVEQSKKLVDYCEKNKLLISGGSDYHGSFKPTVSLGLDYNYDKYLTWI